MTQTQALALLPASAMAVDAKQAAEFAGQLMKHAQAGGPMFPKDLSPAQATLMARLSIAYGLDPIAGELTLYQGRPYVTIDGRVRVANAHYAFDGIECVPASDEERKSFRAADDEHLWVARVWRKDRQFPFVGYGRSAGRSDKNPVSQTYAQEMAQKRAKHRALRDAFSLPLPGREEADDTSPGRPSVQVYDAPAGEIVDAGSFVDLDATNTITPEQIKAIHTVTEKLKWSDDEYRDVLRHTYAVESSKDLLEGQAASILEMLHTLDEAGTGAAFLARIQGVVDGSIERIQQQTGKSRLDAIAQLAWGDDDAPATPPPAVDDPTLAQWLAKYQAGMKAVREAHLDEARWELPSNAGLEDVRAAVLSISAAIKATAGGAS